MVSAHYKLCSLGWVASVGSMQIPHTTRQKILMRQVAYCVLIKNERTKNRTANNMQYTVGILDSRELIFVADATRVLILVRACMTQHSLRGLWTDHCHLIVVGRPLPGNLGRYSQIESLSDRG